MIKYLSLLFSILKIEHLLPDLEIWIDILNHFVHWNFLWNDEIDLVYLIINHNIKSVYYQ